MLNAPSIREVKLAKINRIKQEIEDIRDINADSYQLPTVNDILEELNKQLLESLKQYYKSLL